MAENGGAARRQRISRDRESLTLKTNVSTNRRFVRTIEIAGPTTFYVVKVFSNTPVNPDRPPKWIRVRPNLKEEEAQRIAKLPEISYAAIWGQAVGRLGACRRS